MILPSPGGTRARAGRLRAVPVIAALAVAAVTSGCGSGGPALQELTAERYALDRWQGRAARSYSFHYALVCFCPTISGVVTVTDGVPTAFRPDPDPTGSRVTPALSDLPTIESLIRTVAEARRKATGEVSVRYDPATGVPVEARIDWIKDAVDDETAWTVTDLVVRRSSPRSAPGT